MATALEYAKQFCRNETSIATYIGYAETPATERFKQVLGNEDYERYYNLSATYSITSYAVSGNDTLKTKVQVSGDIRFLRNGDLVTIGGTKYAGIWIVRDIDYTLYTFDINKTFTSTETATFTVNIAEKWKMGLAWLICYFATLTLQELLDKKVLANSQQFGDGVISQSNQDDKKILRETYLSNAMKILGKQFAVKVI